MAPSGGVSSGEGKCKDQHLWSACICEIVGTIRAVSCRSVKLTSEVENTATDRLEDLPKE
jgi:hypothetical protein